MTRDNVMMLNNARQRSWRNGAATRESEDIKVEGREVCYIHLLRLPGCGINQTSTGTPEASFR
eukprot:608954-Rhodomonas_salina.1